MLSFVVLGLRAGVDLRLERKFSFDITTGAVHVDDNLGR
jgi:hypothetical protein